jgi:hypothetical protein
MSGSAVIIGDEPGEVDDTVQSLASSRYRW